MIEPFGEEWKQTGQIVVGARSPFVNKAESPEDYFPYKNDLPSKSRAQISAGLMASHQQAMGGR